MFLPTLLRIIEVTIEPIWAAKLLPNKEGDRNTDASQTDIAEKDEEGNSIDQDEPDIGGEITPQSSEIMKPPEQPKKVKKKSDSIPDKEIAQAIQKLDEIANKSTEDKPYDLFGRLYGLRSSALSVMYVMHHIQYVFLPTVSLTLSSSSVSRFVV
ncbi:hypothetical protein TNCV_1547161 [Trichonephila clavipes]|nr:hypothetical protein TNCV_1547161 [Trichonephila clavipes]